MTKPIMYLTRDFTGVTPESILKGIFQGGKEEKQTVIALKGGFLHSEESFIYNLFDPDKIVGLVTWASTDLNEKNQYYDKFRNSNCVSLSIDLPNMKSIVADSYLGMKEAILHLITVHSLKKILFIRGPENHGYAQERYKAYLDILKEENIPIDNSLITPPGSWGIDWGYSSITDFVDKRGLIPGKDFNAVVCANDNIAIGAINQLKSRKIKVPETVAVIGYNNSEDARCFTPSITTVAMPFFTQGYEAIKTILKLERNEEIPNKMVKLPASLAIGQSCGCLSKMVENALSGNFLNEEINKKTIIKKRLFKPIILNKNIDNTLNQEKAINNILEKFLPIINNSSIYDNRIEEFTKESCNALISELEENQNGIFLAKLTNFISYLSIKNIYFETLQEMLSIIRMHIGQLIVDCKNYVIAEDILSQGRVLISEETLKYKEKKTLEMYDQTVYLQRISSNLMTALTIDLILDALKKDLVKLNIPGAYISLFENPAKNVSINSFSNFHVVYGKYTNNSKISSKELYPGDFIDKTKPSCFIVHPLIFKNLKFGHIIYEAGVENGLIYNTISEQISSSLYAIYMHNENENVKNKLKDILDALEKKIEVVSQNSNSINAGIHEGSTAMEQIAANIKEISKNLLDVTHKIEMSVKQIDNTNSEVTKLLEETHKIGNIVSIISDIAERTKLLSFNASIEAARAGNPGKGFSIVSKEVKNLAYSTLNSAENIKETITNVQTVTVDASESVLELKKIIRQISDSYSVIEHAIDEQSIATGEISSLFVNAAYGTEQIAMALNELKEIAHTNE